MVSITTYEQCVDRCEDRHVEGVAFDFCLDSCDERFAAGREPKGNLLDLVPVVESSEVPE